jgi:hypothetical protein
MTRAAEDDTAQPARVALVEQAMSVRRASGCSHADALIDPRREGGTIDADDGERT